MTEVTEFMERCKTESWGQLGTDALNQATDDGDWDIPLRGLVTRRGLEGSFWGALLLLCLCGSYIKCSLCEDSWIWLYMSSCGLIYVNMIPQFKKEHRCGALEWLSQLSD